MLVRLRNLFLFPFLCVLILFVLNLGGRWTLPSEVRLRELALSYGVQSPLAGVPAELLQAVSLGAKPDGESARVTLPPGSTVATSGPRLIFPHFGDGQAPQIGRTMQTTVNLLNDTEYAAKVKLKFFDDSGKKLPVRIEGVTASEFTSTIVAGRSARFLTDGAGSLKSGWILVTSDQPVAGNCSFSLTDSKGSVRTDVGVSESPLAREFTLFVDTLGSVTTGLALANPGDESVDLTLELRDLNGVVLSSFAMTLASHGHWARFIPEIFKNVTQINELEASLTIRGDRDFAGMTLRSVGAVLTSVPLVPAPDPDLEREKILFPQVADGTSGQLKVYTTILLMNNTDSPSSGEVVFRESDGGLMTVKIGNQTASVFPFNLGPRAVQRLTTSAGSVLQAGWAEVSMDQPVAGAGIFHLAQAGQVVSEAGVSASIPASFINLVSDSLGQARTGIAVANPSDESISVTVRLFDQNGVSKGTQKVDLPPFGHTSLFVDQLFSSVAGIKEAYGSARLSSGDLFSAMSLRQVDTLTTSLPTLWPQHGFAPLSLLGFTQNVAGTAPTVRWQVSLPGNDTSVDSGSISAPDLGLDLSGLSLFDSVAWGFWSVKIQGNSLGGTASLVLTSTNPAKFKVKASGGLFGAGGIEVAEGGFSGTPSGGLTITLDSLQLGLGSWNRGVGIDLDLFLRPRIVKHPSGAKQIQVTSRFNSASIKIEEPRVSAVWTLVQPQAVVAAQDGAARLDRILPTLPASGQLAILEGTGFGEGVEVVFSDKNGNPYRVLPESVEAKKIEVLVPWGAFDGPVRVDKGGFSSNPLDVKLLFQPVPDLASAGPESAQGIPLRFLIEQGPMQLAVAGFEWTVTNASRGLGGLAAGTQVGTAETRVGGILTSELVVKVVESKADSLLLELLDKDDQTKKAADLTITVAPGTLTGLLFRYEPSPPLVAPTLNANQFQFEIKLTSLPVQVGLDGSPGVSWTSNIRSCPPEGSGSDSSIHTVISK